MRLNRVTHGQTIYYQYEDELKNLKNEDGPVFRVWDDKFQRPIRRLSDTELEDRTFLCMKEGRVFTSNVEYIEGIPHVDDIRRRMMVPVKELNELYLITINKSARGV